MKYHENEATTTTQPNPTLQAKVNNITKLWGNERMGGVQSVKKPGFGSWGY